MQGFWKVPPAISRALITAALLLVGLLTGCEPEVTTSHEEEGVTGKSSSALVTYFDFIASASQATWTNNDGVVPWGTNEQYGRGANYTTTGALMDGTTQPFLATRAKWGGAGSFIRAAYNVTIPAASQHPTATATFGFSGCCGDEVFSLKTQINGSWVNLMSTQKGFQPTTFTTTTADLSAYAGQTLTLYLYLEGVYEDALAAWTDFRIVTDSQGPGPTQCSIYGVNYLPGAVNPVNSCEVCAPTINPVGWTTTGSGCRATYYDFIGNASGAFWANNDGPVAWGTVDMYGRGIVTKTSGVLEDGLSHQFLYTQPKWTGDLGIMRGAFPVVMPPASQHPSLTATFGYQGMGNGNFSIRTQIDGAWINILNQTKATNNALVTATADLSAYAGKTMTLFLFVEGVWRRDVAAWTDLRILTDSVTPPGDGCVIGGIAYADGAVNPGLSCQVCDPTANVTAWTTKADSCMIGGQCYSADTQDSLGCRRCDPLVSQSSWTNKTQCENLVVGVTNATTYGNVGTLAQADAACASGGAPLGLPGVWKAAIATSARHYKDSVPGLYSSKPVVNLRGELLYATWNSIFTNQVWPTGLSTYGFGTATTPAGSAFNGFVWTGAAANGNWDASLTGANCASWTTWASTYYAKAGDFSQRKLVDGGVAASCGTLRPLACVLQPPGPQVTIQNYDGTAMGTIEGMSHNDAYAYRGVPFAAPPTGSLRLAPPAKVTSWSGVRTAYAQAQPCPQPPLLPLGGMIGSEDCLYLNVWTPKSANPATPTLPVLVFHHGGAHMFGGTVSSADWLATGYLDGDRLASAQNVIVVTLQSRLGPLGYLADPALAANATSRTSAVGGGTSGNYGMLDFIQALKWVKRNISKFGGDPTKVSISGQSSGATQICDLIASPLAKDPSDNTPYFSSAIIQSGFCEQPSVAYRHAQATPAIASIGCGSAPDKVACLRSASLQSFINVEGSILGYFPDMFASSTPPERAFGLTWGAHIDGYFLTQQPRLSFAAGTHNKVPVIVGTTKEEATFFMLFMVGGILTGDLPNLIILVGCNSRDTKVTTNLGATLANAVKSLYPCNPFDLLSPTKSYAYGVTQAQYECPARRTARALTLGQTQPVRRYWFTHGADHLGIIHNLLGLFRDMGASHTFELPFIFNTHNTVLGYWPSTRERNLGTAIQSYWRNFANSGDPNYTGGVNWTAYTTAQDNAMKLEVTGKTGPSDPGLQMVNGINTTNCDFWDNNFTLDGWK